MALFTLPVSQVAWVISMVLQYRISLCDPPPLRALRSRWDKAIQRGLSVSVRGAEPGEKNKECHWNRKREFFRPNVPWLAGLLDTEYDQRF